MKLLQQIAILLGTITFLSSIFIDYIIEPEHFKTSLQIRVFPVIPFFIIALYLTFKKSHKKYFPYFIASLAPIVSVTGMINMVITGGMTLYIYPIGIYISIIWAYFSIGVHYKLSVISNIIVGILWLLAEFIYFHSPLELSIPITFYMFCFSIIGLVTSRQIQTALSKLDEKTRALDTANEILKKSYDEKTTAFINIAHETKTPLTLIKNYFSKYKEKQTETDDLIIIERNLIKLERDMIHFLKMEKEEHSSTIESFNYNTNLSKALSNGYPLYSSYFTNKNLVLDLQIEPNVYVGCSPQDIEHIIVNLLENAYKFSFSGTTVSVSVTNKKNDYPLLTVKNRGELIPQDSLSTIFKPYQQISYPKSQKQGLGMGLSIVAKIIERYHGKITVNSNKEEGTEFRVIFPPPNTNIKKHHDVSLYKLPVYFQEEPSRVIIKNDNPKNLLKSLMIIEDDIALQNYLAEEFRHNYVVYTANNGKEAFDILNNLESSPSIIISDVMMDEMDGFYFLSQWNKDHRHTKTPVIFLSADDSEQNRMEGLSLGAIDFINKPFHIDELKLKISIWLSIFSQGDISDEKLNQIELLRSKYLLSVREIQVLNLLLKGETRKRIAENLFISINTLKSHISSIYSKLSVTNKTELFNFIETFENEKS